MFVGLIISKLSITEFKIIFKSYIMSFSNNPKRAALVFWMLINDPIKGDI